MYKCLECHRLIKVRCNYSHNYSNSCPPLIIGRYNLGTQITLNSIDPSNKMVVQIPFTCIIFKHLHQNPIIKYLIFKRANKY